MAKVAIVLADMFEDVELTSPKQALENAGHETTIIGTKAGETVTGKTEGTEVTVEKAFTEVSPADFDALLIPGGYSPDHLRADDDALAFVRGMFADVKPTFSICHGPQLLVNADVLNGKTITAVKQVAIDVKNAGATFVDDEVIIDEKNKLVSSRTPADIPAFDQAIVDKLAEWQN